MNFLPVPTYVRAITRQHANLVSRELYLSSCFSSSFTNPIPSQVYAPAYLYSKCRTNCFSQMRRCEQRPSANSLQSEFLHWPLLWRLSTGQPRTGPPLQRTNSPKFKAANRQRQGEVACCFTFTITATIALSRSATSRRWSAQTTGHQSAPPTATDNPSQTDDVWVVVSRWGVAK